VVVERGVWQGTRLMEGLVKGAGARWALLGCTVSPGFEFEDYEPGVRERLCAEWPEFAVEITGLTRD
jgi:predicted cupin superfamily sugar epimerase